MAARQRAVSVIGAGEVGVQPAAGGAHVGAGPSQEPGVAQLAEGGVPVPGVAVLVDVQDVGPGSAGGDREVPVGVAAEPGGDLPGVGGGVQVAVPGGRGLLARLAGQHRPSVGGEGQRLAERRASHGLVQGWRSAGAGLRGWPQRLVSFRSWSARAGRMRAWYSAWAETRAGLRAGCRYRTDHSSDAMSSPYRHRSWAGQQGPRAAARWP